MNNFPFGGDTTSAPEPSRCTAIPGCPVSGRMRERRESGFLRIGKRIARWGACTVLALGLLCTAAKAQKEIPAESDAEGAKIAQSPQFKAFIDQYVAAVNAKDQKALRMLYDPVSQAAMAKDAKNASRILESAVEGHIPAKYETVVSVIGPDEPLMFQDLGAVYAVRPSAVAQIRFSNDSSSTTKVIFLNLVADRWYEVWTTPPDPKKMEAAFQKKADDERRDEQGVQASGVTEYRDVARPPDSFTKRYNWVVRLTADDSKKGPYEIVQIDQPERGAARTEVLVRHPASERQAWMDVLHPNDHGFVGFKLGIGAENAPNLGGVLLEPYLIQGLGNGRSWSGSVQLPGTVLQKVTPSLQGTAMADGTLRIAQFHTANEKGERFVTDVVLRMAKVEPAAAGKQEPDRPKAAASPASDGSWAPNECSNPLKVPAGYRVLKDGPGKYRVVPEGNEALGTIFIVFQEKGTPDPETVPGSRTAPMRIRGQQFFWRVYPAQVEGKGIVRKEVLMPNFLPREKRGNEADYIFMKVEAPTQQGLNTLAPVAHGIIRDGL